MYSVHMCMYCMYLVCTARLAILAAKNTYNTYHTTQIHFTSWYIQIHFQYIQYIHIWIDPLLYVVCMMYVSLWNTCCIHTNTYPIHLCMYQIHICCNCMYVSVFACIVLYLPATSDVNTSYRLPLVLRARHWKDSMETCTFQFKRFGFLFQSAATAG